MKVRFVGLAALGLLAACGSGRDEAVEQTALEANTVVEAPIEPAVEPEVAPPAPTVNQSVTNTVQAAPPPQVSEEAQTLEDADATGMTARVDRDATATGNEADRSLPAEEN